MLLTINKNSKIPVYKQIFNQITELIDKGTLKSGDRLPSSRELAKTTGVNRTTIIRAYEELWIHGHIVSTTGSYTTIRNRKQIIFKNGESNYDNILNPDIYTDSLNLEFDSMMYYLENGKVIEKGKINFLQLAPDTRLLDRKYTGSCMRKALNQGDANPFDFAPARGYKPLRQEIKKRMELHNIHIEDKNILITNGSLQSLQLILQVFSKPGDYIVVESPTYSIVLLFIKIFKLKVIDIPVSDNGMDMKLLERMLKNRPIRFIYTMPTYQNPTGVSMSQNKREELIRLCEEKNCIIIEDSTEEEMFYSGKAFLPIKSIDKKEQVIYLGAFTKIMAPGLRAGWIIASSECIKKLTVLKSIFEISSGTINQLFLYNFFVSGAFDIHLRKTISVFKKRMKVAVSSIKKYIPPEKIEWIEPKGGYMIWMKLLNKQIENIENHFSNYGVLIHNGRYFFVKEQANNYIRICIAQVNEKEIEEGIIKIAAAIKALESGHQTKN